MKALSLILILLCGLSSLGQGQTLGEVLRAVQNRKQLLGERQNVKITLENEASGYQNPTIPVELIDWELVPAFPTDEQASTQSVANQLKLLKQAWQEVDGMKTFFLDTRKFIDGAGSLNYSTQFEETDSGISLENFGQKLQILAQKISRMKTLDWPLLWTYEKRTWGQGNLSSIPSPPLNTSPVGDETGPFTMYEASIYGGVSVGFAGGKSSTEDPQSGTPVIKYGFNGASIIPVSLKVKTPDSFSGHIQLFSDFYPLAKAINGLVRPPSLEGGGDADTLYHAGNKRWLDAAVTKNTVSDLGSPPGIFGDVSGLTFPGTWEYYSWTPQVFSTYFRPTVPNQNNALLWKQIYDPLEPYSMFFDGSSAWFFGINVGNWISWYEIYFGGGAQYGQTLQSHSVYVVDFGQEFSSPSLLPPERAMPLQIIPDLEHHQLKVKLASGFANDCELVWAFPATILKSDGLPMTATYQPQYYNFGFGALSARHVLGVIGSGVWDAIYSGEPQDREAELAWQGDRFNVNGRWPNFESYLVEWWQPVLTQLVTATYGLNVTQQGDYKYKIDFYRKDQVGQKNSATGRYSFSGSPVETFIVENPNQNNAEAGLLKITTSKAEYDLALTQTKDTDNIYIDSSWLLMINQAGSNCLTKNVSVSATRYNGSTITQPLKVEDQTSVDGVALPKVTTTYWDAWANPLRVDKIIEDGSDGVRTTTYSYAHDSNNNITHLTDIAQTGGVNPYVASYDANEQLTEYVEGPTDIQIAYSGSNVTRTEKFNGATVRTQVTTYSESMGKASTTVNETADAVPEVVELYPGNDPVNPWGLKSLRGPDGTLSTFAYVWQGNNFVTTRESGRGATSVTNGMRVVTKVNGLNQVFSREVFDIESGAKLDFATATLYQDSIFPSVFSRPLGTTETCSYDGQGRVTDFTDRLGETTTLTRDGLERVTRTVRAGVTTDISYNPGYLGRFITQSAAGQANRTWDERTSPFDKTQSMTVVGPENSSMTRTESGSVVTTSTVNSTTAQSVTETMQKASLASDVTGNATEPLTITSSVSSSGGWKRTVTHANAANLKTITTTDALGRIIKEESPDPVGSGLAAVNYTYSGGRLASVTDPSGTTEYAYQPDGSLQKTSRGDRFVSVDRITSSSSQIKWEWKDATGEVLWQQAFFPGTGVTEDYPRGKTARKIVTTPSVSGNVMTLASSGTGLSQSSSWNDGVPSEGNLNLGAGKSSWTAASNLFGDVTSRTVKTGDVAANSLTTSYSPLGLPTGTSGLISSAVSNNFGSSGWTQIVSRNGHSETEALSPKGDVLGKSGYGLPDTSWTTPNYGSSSSIKAMGTGAGSAQFTSNLAGQLTERKFPDGTGENFSYNSGGALTSWTKPGGASFSFAPNAFGQPTQIGSMGSLGYDLAGRVNAMTDAAGTHARSYVDGQLDVESHSSGVLNGQSVDRDYDALGHLSAVKLPGNVTIGYRYDATTGELTGVTTAGGASGTWSNFDGVTGKAKTSTLGPLTVAETFDSLGRVSSHGNNPGSGLVNFTYGYDGDGHCNSVAGPNGNWTLAYDGNGYLASATGGGNFTYSFDEAGRHPDSTDFRPTLRLNSSLVGLEGSVDPTATVKINGVSATVDPATGVFSQNFTPAPGWQNFTVRGTITGGGDEGHDAIAEQTQSIFVPPASEGLGYDASGNRSSNSRWTHGWNNLDQLTTLEEVSPQSAATKQQIDCIYDLQGRRVEKKTRVGGAVTKRTTTLWDGWRPAMEIDYDASNTEQTRRYYSWGPDVSGSIDGAAGIGGLLEILEKKGALTVKSLPIYDGIGNVIGLVDGVSGTRVATYKYGPFGEVKSVLGERADSCPFRFQTKLYDSETGYYYFGKRYYDPSTQTWISRDPLREEGGVNLYAYCSNDPVNGIDPIGLETTFLNQVWDSYLFLAEQDYKIKLAFRDSAVAGIDGILNQGGHGIVDLGTSAVILNPTNPWALNMSWDERWNARKGLSEQIWAQDAQWSRGIRQLTGAQDNWTYRTSRNVTPLAEAAPSAGYLVYRGALYLPRMTEASMNLLGKVSLKIEPGLGMNFGNVRLVFENSFPSSRVLGRNLISAGEVRPAEAAAHHIVAGLDPRAAIARSILKREAIGINEAENGVFLPEFKLSLNPNGAQVHSTVHTDVYYDTVDDLLFNAEPGTVIDVLLDIRMQLQQGTFPH